MDKNKWSDTIWNCLIGDLVFGLYKVRYENTNVTDFEKKRERNAVSWLLNDNKNIYKINSISDIHNKRSKVFDKYKSEALKIMNLAKEILEKEHFDKPTITREQCKNLYKKYNS